MESPNTESYRLRVKKEELIKIKEELKKAKENATQSWLDSRPLIDELERRKSNHENAQTRVKMSKTLVSELETTNLKIKLKKEEELQTTKMVHEITRALDQLREEMESLKSYAGEKRQKKMKLKRVLRLRRQKLRSLQLRMEAVRKETEACGESRDETFRYLNASETIVKNKGLDDHDHEQIRVLSHEEYMALKKRVDDENLLADWRVSIATEQKIEAEKSRDLAKERLRGMKMGKRVMRGRNKVKNNTVGKEDIERVVKEEKVEEGGRGDNREIMEVNIIPMADQPGKEHYGQGQEMRRTEKNNKKKENKKKLKKKKKKMIKGKKRSFFWQMKQCFVFDIIRRLFRR